MKAADAVKRYGLVQDGLEQNLEEIPDGGEWVSYEDHVAALSAAEERERALARELLIAEEVMKYRARIEREFNANVNVKQRVAYWKRKCEAQLIAANTIAALATPAPEQPSEQNGGHNAEGV